jgi:phospholipase C
MSPPPFDPSRRRFFATIAAGTAGVAGLGACSSSPAGSNSKNPGDGGSPPPGDGGSDGSDGSDGGLPALPAPGDSGIDHIVVVMMENRSFDHYFGWLPGADGKQTGLSFKDSNGATQTTHGLAPNYQNCQSADPDHTYEGGRTHLNDGKMDGFLLTQPVGDTFPIGYYGEDDLPFFRGCVDNWTICDRYFSGILSQTYPNRVYMHAGQTDRNTNTLNVSTLTTVWDQLQSVGKVGRYYYNDLPLTVLWGSKYVNTISKLYANFKSDAAAGKLPDVCFVDPFFNGEDKGTSKDDHPLADIRDGQAFLNDVYNTLRNSPNWSKTLLIINYDEWGGFFEHVVPPIAPVTTQEKQAIGNDGRLGFRVPCVIIGPRAKRKHIEHQQFDPNSILNFIAWRFGFQPLGARGTSSLNLAYALDWSDTPDVSAPAFTVGAGPFGKACPPPPLSDAGPDAGSGAGPDAGGNASANAQQAEMGRRQREHLEEWRQLRIMAERYGFPIG